MKKFLILLLLLISSCSDNQSNNKFIENEYPPRLQIESRLYKISDSEIDNVWFYKNALCKTANGAKTCSWTWKQNNIRILTSNPDSQYYFEYH